MECETARARDPRIAAGMARQLAARAAALRDGARPLGWKVALTTAASQRAAGLDQRVVGHLTDRTLLADGAEVAIGGWSRAMIEGELAITLGADLPPGADEAAAAAAIGALSAAIELVDVTLPLDAVEEVIAGDVFHRAVMLGPPQASRHGGDDTGISVRASLDGVEVAREDDPRAVIGAPVDVVRFVADELARHGERLSAGDVVIAGSAIPLTPVAPGQRLRVEVAPLGALELSFTT
ncbi:fumarylacetoacetate hydrolase family protein [Conexibacter stalactiti]|uniref:Fumarylacetoacetate hydrolase family protein n=1 Tax=Conexibacter stalactiti TaxID=1940611 RepID=A0ABU4HMI6_9ACTN|nr:fumarylacetoacetate hydrolase family protein [Conexibacter stalactiti]MDW5594512.1 fumarylacetoacetate hydrolase family protein [Conexibacter stalactiti]MEC5035154.1 fumarylacetoacetate hydrolase family protein [Conexibacter stalactiti]